MGYFYGWAFDWTWLLLIPALIISAVAQSKVSSTYKRFSRVPNQKGITGAAFAQDMLRRNNVSGIRIQSTGGVMTDHFDPRNMTVNLSEGVHSGRSVASVAIAAHECGHVLQKQTNYVPMKIRAGLVPVVNLCSRLSFPLIIIGIIFSGFEVLINIGVWIYFAVVVFQLVTLPVEFNASGRALANIEASDMLTATEQSEAKEMLSAAALTYVAAMLSSFLSFLRLLLIARRRNN